MKSRLRNLHDNKLATELSQLEQDTQALKSSSQYLGGSSVVFFTSTAAGTYDWSGTIPDPIGLGSGGIVFLVTATAETMDVLYAVLYVDLYVGTPLAPYDGAALLTDFAGGVNAFQTTFTDVPNDTNEPTVKQWFCQLAGDTVRQAAVKFRIEALDHAAVTITVVS
jgi:hypothetical protein